MKVVYSFDCTVLEGYRSPKRQHQLFMEGKSKVDAGESKHNASPSLAVDVAPCPIDWNDKERFYLFAGYVLGRADALGIKIRWGGDWDQDTLVDDQTFNDLVHFELIE